MILSTFSPQHPKTPIQGCSEACQVTAKCCIKIVHHHLEDSLYRAQISLGDNATFNYFCNFITFQVLMQLGKPFNSKKKGNIEDTFDRNQ